MTQEGTQAIDTPSITRGAESIPVVFEGRPLEGTVILELEKPTYMVAVVVSVSALRRGRKIVYSPIDRLSGWKGDGQDDTQHGQR